MLSKSLKDAAIGGALLGFFLICLFTGGYPYYVYYCLFLFTPYLLAFLAKPLREQLFGPCFIHFKRAFGTLAVAGGAALLVCAPYILGINRLMADTIDRAGKDFRYSTSHVFNFEDTVGSLVYPPAASAEGWYFFSITGLLVILLYWLSSESAKRRTHDRETGADNKNALIPPQPHNLWVKLFFFIWICIITYISYGRYSYLFKLLWKFMPGFSSLRVWGRLNIILACTDSRLAAFNRLCFVRIGAVSAGCLTAEQRGPPAQKSFAVIRTDYYTYHSLHGCSCYPALPLSQKYS